MTQKRKGEKMKRLEGKIVVITGCSTGIGKQVAIRFAQEGASLAICARGVERLMETKELCEKAGADVLAMGCDVMKYEDLVAFTDAIKEKFGRVDVLINNACITNIVAPFIEQPLDDLMGPLMSGAVATWHMMKLCFPMMKDNGGSIINLASGSIDGAVGMAGYGAAKAAVAAMTRTIALEWGQYNIRANCISPNAVIDKLTGDVKGMDLPEEFKAYIQVEMAKNALGRVGRPWEDITPVFVFMASDEASWITGQVIKADGGVAIHE